MKIILSVMVIWLHTCSLIAQEDAPTPSSLYIKFDLGEIIYDFPRLGIGLEKKFANHSVWSSFHYGWEGLNFGNNQFYYSDPFQIWGIKAGVKRRNQDGLIGHYLGSHIEFDHTSADVLDDAFYDLKNKDAILFDTGTFQRDRVRLFLEQGYDFFSGDRFTLEWSSGIGISWINIHYKNVVNPFLLNDVEPLDHHRKSQHKYAGTKWKFALSNAIKVGIRL